MTGWWLGVATNRLVVLRDRATVDAGRFGADLVAAGSGADVAFGQDGNDWVGGGNNDDALEGNGGADTLVGDNAPALLGTNGEPVVTGPSFASTDVDRDGAPTADGEDDIVGGSNVSHRDGVDTVAGNGEDDFVLGDNGTLRRNIASGAYVNYSGDGAHLRIMRRATRLDVGTSAGAGVWGGDTLRGNAGDDAIWGQDGNDTVYGGAGDDDLFGELGDDTMYGGSGQDAMIGDRGGVLDTTLGDTGASFAAAAVPVQLQRPAVHHLHRVPSGHLRSASRSDQGGRRFRRRSVQWRRGDAGIQRSDRRRPRHDAWRSGSRLDARGDRR